MRILVLLFISFFSFSQEEQYRSEFAWCNLKDENLLMMQKILQANMVSL